MPPQSQYVIGLYRDVTPTKNRCRHNIGCPMGYHFTFVKSIRVFITQCVLFRNIRSFTESNILANNMETFVKFGALAEKVVVLLQFSFMV